MSERPTLSVAVPCPTCGGRGRVTAGTVDPRINRKTGEYVGGMKVSGPCPDCTDGTIRQAVSCAGCRIADFDMGALFCSEIGLTVDPDFGCLSWEAKA